ncbi:hypothetical protein [Candidatus Poriferisodalis sp.]|uniref:hypothetical protein n=1 Tax=Candidatus Poriferisodalis sp. TaxID=3101277 RepID=UPI003B01AA52
MSEMMIDRSAVSGFSSLVASVIASMDFASFTMSSTSFVEVLDALRQHERTLPHREGFLAAIEELVDELLDSVEEAKPRLAPFSKEDLAVAD